MFVGIIWAAAALAFALSFFKNKEKTAFFVALRERVRLLPPDRQRSRGAQFRWWQLKVLTHLKQHQKR